MEKKNVKLAAPSEVVYIQSSQTGGKKQANANVIFAGGFSLSCLFSEMLMYCVLWFL